MSYRLADIDQALYDLFAGSTIDVLGTEVTPNIYVEDPEYTDMVFPAISVSLGSPPTFDPERAEGRPENNNLGLIYDQGNPIAASVQAQPEPVTLVYIVQTYAVSTTELPGAAVDRELVELVAASMPARFALDIQGEPVFFERAGASNTSTRRPAHTRYQRTFTYNVKAWITPRTTQEAPIVLTTEVASEQASADE